jgi:uroporphyrinogen-III synthase
MTVLLIRANRNSDDRDALLEFGVASHTDPYLAISLVPNPAGALKLLDRLEHSNPVWLVITSQNALTYWYQQCPAGSLEALLGKTPHLRYAAIGALTAEVLRVFGVKDILIPDSRDSASLAELIAQHPSGTVVIPSGNIAMRSIPEKLTPLGFEIVEEVFYATTLVQNPPPSLALIQAGKVDTVLLRSPSAARALFSFVPHIPSSLSIVCGGETTAREVRRLGFPNPLVAPDPTPRAVARFIAENRSQGGRR